MDHKRYNLVLPIQMWLDLSAVAERKMMSVAALLRIFIKLGLTFVEFCDSDPQAKLYARFADSDEEYEIDF